MNQQPQSTQSSEKVHELAWHGDWEGFKKLPLTQKDIEYKTIIAGTILHAAAKQNKFDYIPKELHTFSNYSLKDNTGKTVFEMAIANKNLWKIPKELFIGENAQKVAKLSCKALDSRSLLSHILDRLKENDFPKDILSPELLMSEEYEEMHHIHVIGRRGWLKYLPKGVFTKDLVMLKDTGGSNLLHYAARYEGLRVIPKEFLTKENLSIRSKNGKTPVHWALANGKLESQIPEGVLTTEIMTIKDELGETPYHSAAHSLHVREIPKNLICESGLLIEDNKGKSALDYILTTYYTKDNIVNLRGTLSILSTKMLEEIKETKKNKLILSETNKELVRRRIKKDDIEKWLEI